MIEEIEIVKELWMLDAPLIILAILLTFERLF